MNKKAVNLSLYAMLLAGIICGCSERMGVVDANKSVTDKSPKTISKEIKPVKEKQIILKDKLIYTNLNSKPAIDEVRLALRQSGIKDEYINNVFEWVADYNTCMKDCKEFSLVGDFTTVSAKAIDYGDWYKMSKEWFKKIIGIIMMCFAGWLHFS